MKAIVVGCGRLGAELAYRLYQRGNEVSIVDLDEKSFENLPADFHGKFSEGDALDLDVLRRAGIEQADSLAAVTDNDMINGVVGHLAQTFFRIPNVVTRNYDPKYRPVLEAYGLQLISPLSWGAQRIDEMMYSGNVQTVFSAGNGEVEVYQLTLTEECEGKTLAELVQSGLCIPIAVTRAGTAQLPDPNLKLQAGDVLHVSATFEGAASLRGKICLPKAERPRESREK